jgi:hypothetical protein
MALRAVMVVAGDGRRERVYLGVLERAGWKKKKAALAARL